MSPENQDVFQFIKKVIFNEIGITERTIARVAHPEQRQSTHMLG
jgi:hypothetical protein